MTFKRLIPSGPDGNLEISMLLSGLRAHQEALQPLPPSLGFGCPCSVPALIRCSCSLGSGCWGKSCVRRSYGKPHGDLLPFAWESCVEAQASILETGLRYACAWPCALLILNHWFDLLAWPCTCFITADESSNLEYCLTLLTSVVPAQVLRDCAHPGGIIALPAVPLPSAPGFLPLWGSRYLLLPESSYPRAVNAVCYMEKLVSRWQSVHVRSRYTWSNRTKLINSGDTAEGQLLSVVTRCTRQQQSPQTGEQVGNAWSSLQASAPLTLPLPFKLNSSYFVSVKVRLILMNTAGQNCSGRAAWWNHGIYMSRRVRESTWSAFPDVLKALWNKCGARGCLTQCQVALRVT